MRGARGRRRARGWSPTWRRRRRTRPRRPTLRAFLARARCRTTWSRPPSCSWTRCRSRRTARWTAGRSPRRPRGDGRRRRRSRRRARRPRSCWPASGASCWASSGWGPHDDFFALGGHSLLATRLVVAHARRRFGVELPLRGAVRGAHARRPRARASTPSSRGAAAPAGAAARRRAARPAGDCRSPSRSSGSGSSTGSSRRARPTTSPARCGCAGALDPALLARGPGARSSAATRRCAPSSATLRRRAGAGDRCRRPRPAAAGRRSRARCRRTRASRRPRRLLDGGGAAAVRPRARAAAARACCSAWRRGAPARRRSMHHIVSDGWSLGVLLRELSALYAALRRRRALAAAPSCRSSTPTSPRWQRQLARGASVLAAELAHWRRALAGAPEALDLPADRPRPAPPSLRRRGAARSPCRRRWRRRSRRSRRRAGVDALHGPPRRLRRAARAAHRPARPGGRLADRQPQPPGDRGADRLLHQHPGAARSTSRATRRSAALVGRARAGDAGAPTPTRTCRSSGWSRSWRRERELGPHPALPGDAGAPETPAGRAWRCRASTSSRSRSRAATAKFDLTLFLAERRGRLRRPPGVQPRPLRPGDRRAPAAGTSRALLAGAVAAPETRLSRAAAAHRRRARRARRLEPARRCRARAVAASTAVRRAGRAPRRRPWRWSSAASGSPTASCCGGPAGWPRRLRARAWGRTCRWGLPRALARPGGRPPRRAQGRRRLCAARSRLSAGAPAPDAGGRRGCRWCSPQAALAGALPAGRRVLLIAEAPAGPEPATGAAGRGRRPGQPRLRRSTPRARPAGPRGSR